MADSRRLLRPTPSWSCEPAFAFDAEPREGVASELCSMEYVPALRGFLVITASEDSDNAFHGNTMWFVADGETRPASEDGVHSRSR